MITRVGLILLLIALVGVFVWLVAQAANPEANPLYNIDGLFMIKKV